MWLAQDVCIRYFLEKVGYTDVGRVIPEDYVFFMGDGRCTNYFCEDYHQSSLAFAIEHAWDWSLPSPYND